MVGSSLPEQLSLDFDAILRVVTSTSLASPLASTFFRLRLRLAVEQTFAARSSSSAAVPVRWLLVHQQPRCRREPQAWQIAHCSLPVPLLMPASARSPILATSESLKGDVLDARLPKLWHRHDAVRHGDVVQVRGFGAGP